MSEESEILFCSECGRELSPGEKFCPFCGRSAGDSEPMNPQTQSQIHEPSQQRTGTSTRLSFLGLLLIIWGLVGLYLAYSFIAGVDTLIDSIKTTDPDAWNEILEYYTEDQIKNIFVGLGALFLVSGIAGLISGVFAVLAKKGKISFILCLIATIFANVMFLPGVFVTIFLHKAKGDFKEW